MGVFFGTDGIRGVVNDSLTFDLAYKLGNALSQKVLKPKVIIGRDTRITGEYLTLALSGGVLSGGGDVVDIGVCTTPMYPAKAAKNTAIPVFMFLMPIFLIIFYFPHFSFLWSHNPFFISRQPIINKKIPKNFLNTSDDK